MHIYVTLQDQTDSDCNETFCESDGTATIRVNHIWPSHYQ